MPYDALNNPEITSEDSEFEAFDAFMRTSTRYLGMDVPGSRKAHSTIPQDGPSVGRYSC